MLPVLDLSAPALAAILLVSGCSRTVENDNRDSASRSSTSSLEAGARAPRAFGMRTSRPDVRAVSPSELFAWARAQEKPLVLVNVWATFCGPCREELPMLARVARAYAVQGLAVVPVSVDDPADAPKVSATLTELGFPAPYYVVAGDLDAFKAAMHPAWPGNVPVSFVFGRGGDLRYYFNTEVYEHELTPVLDELLAAKGSRAP